MPSLPSHVLERFPDQRTAIEALLRADPEFLALCSDHADAVEALKRWRRATDHRRETLIEEYDVLTRDLEHEILEWLRRRGIEPQGRTDR